MRPLNSFRVVIYTDGSCKGQGIGGSNVGVGGWAALLFWADHRLELSGAARDTTNNRMELQAVIEACNALITGCEIDLFTDSQYVITCICSMYGWEKNGWKNRSGEPVSNLDLVQQLAKAIAPHAIHCHWVKGHSGDPSNTRCDQLAYGAMVEEQERINLEQQDARKILSDRNVIQHTKKARVQALRHREFAEAHGLSRREKRRLKRKERRKRLQSKHDPFAQAA